MGFVILPPQLAAIIEIGKIANVESLELLWLRSGIQVVYWTKGQANQVIINEDGVMVNGGDY